MADHGSLKTDMGRRQLGCARDPARPVILLPIPCQLPPTSIQEDRVFWEVTGTMLDRLAWVCIGVLLLPLGLCIWLAVDALIHAQITLALWMGCLSAGLCLLSMIAWRLIRGPRRKDLLHIDARSQQVYIEKWKGNTIVDSAECDLSLVEIEVTEFEMLNWNHATPSLGAFNGYCVVLWARSSWIVLAVCIDERDANEYIQSQPWLNRINKINMLGVITGVAVRKAAVRQ